jgi:hypothetical protein
MTLDDELKEISQDPLVGAGPIPGGPVVTIIGILADTSPAINHPALGQKSRSLFLFLLFSFSLLFFLSPSLVV